VDDGRTGSAGRHAEAMTPILDPAVRALWRDPSTMQLGLDPRAVVVAGLDPGSAALLRDPAPAERLARPLRSRLARLGVPTDDRSARRSEGAASADSHLAPDLATAVLVTGSRSAARNALDTRKRAYVCIEGAGRIGAGVAALLAGAGVGRLRVDDPGTVGPADTAPFGARSRDTGLRRDLACEAAVERHLDRRAPSFDQGPAARPDLVVLAPAHGMARSAAHGLVREGVPHVVGLVEGTTAVVGPLVLPGRSACVQCTDLHRTERDPAWPRLIAQAETQRMQDAPCDLTLATLAAAQLAAAVLAVLGGSRPGLVDGTFETAVPGGVTRRRSWVPHPACGCQWGGAP